MGSGALPTPRSPRGREPFLPSPDGLALPSEAVSPAVGVRVEENTVKNGHENGSAGAGGHPGSAAQPEMERLWG